jgi:hypothetical protein
MSATAIIGGRWHAVVARPNLDRPWQVGAEEPDEKELAIRVDATTRGQVLAEMRFRQQIGKERRQPYTRGARLLDETAVGGFEAQAQRRPCTARFHVTAVKAEHHRLVTEVRQRANRRAAKPHVKRLDNTISARTSKGCSHCGSFDRRGCRMITPGLLALPSSS